ncbi:MAG: menaquinone biosynthesis protein [Desulfovibrio sp.]|nr:menaquinone biosynthesis protein [Desulfovibrio sp.]
MDGENSKSPRMGRISFLNVLPIYYPLESGIIPHNYELVSAPPAILNDMMARGELRVSSCSCIEYARHPGRYYLVPDLSIGSSGPVMSVLLMSSEPVTELDGGEILISGESHTSVALLRLLLKDYYKVSANFKVGNVTAALRSANPPTAFLAIGDEALRLRQRYSYRYDLAEIWREWTGEPFIFGLWVIDAATADRDEFGEDPGAVLRAGRDWGMAHLDAIIDLTAYGCPLTKEELRIYYTRGLTYRLGKEELAGLRLFYEKLAASGAIAAPPPLRFYGE